jgi:ribose 5-phosphate isomerase B
MPKTVITEQTIRELLARGGRSLECTLDTIITPLARELAEAEGIKFISVKMEASPKEGQPGVLKVVPTVQPSRQIGVVAFGSDHGGFQLKGVLMEYAKNLGYPITDVGTQNEEPCDYPDFAYAVAQMVSSGSAWRGVMIDGAGVGSCIVANKVRGIRAACCYNEFVARNAREHNDTNVLTLGSRVTGTEVCKAILKTWLESSFAGGRHLQRLKKVMDVEQRHYP